MNSSIHTNLPVNLDYPAALGVIELQHVTLSLDVSQFEHHPPVSEPNVLSRAEVERNLDEVGNLDVMPVVIRPSGIGPSFNRPVVREDMGRESNQIPVVIVNNQPIGGSPIKRQATDNFKKSCDEYCSCQETQVPIVRNARCMTYYGCITLGSILTGGVLGAVVCCCTMCVTCGVQAGKGKARRDDPCSAFPCPSTSFKKSCLPCI